MPESNMPIKTDYTFSGEVSRGSVIPVVIVDLDTGEPGSSGGGGGAVTIADGADITQGAKSDSVATTNTGSFSLISLFKRLLNISQQNLPFGADYMIQSNADVNGNYQTIVYKTGGSSGTAVKTVTLTFDGSSNVLTYTES